MNLRLYIITFCLLFAGLALHGQAPEKRFVGNCRFSGFALLADSSYRGDIINFTDRMGDGYNLTQLAVGYEIFDGRGLVFEIDTIHESTNFTADVSVTARVDRGFAPFGSGQVYNPTENGLIPPSSQEQAGLSPTQKARIDRHNVVIMQSLIGGRDSVYSITNVPDTTGLSPVLGDAFINSTADTLGLYNGAGWVLFFGGGSIEVADGLTILGDGTGGDPLRVDTTLLATRTYADSLFLVADSLREAGDRSTPILIQAFDRIIQLDGCSTSETVITGFYLLDNEAIDKGAITFEVNASPQSITYDVYNEDSTSYYFETSVSRTAGIYTWEVSYTDPDGNFVGDMNSFEVVAGTPDTVTVWLNDSISITRRCGVEISRDTLRGITDGDKGDIDVSDSGATWVIDTGVVGADELASTAVTPGSYTYSSFTVDADGRVTAASSGTTPVTGSLTSGYIPRASGATTLANSGLYWDGFSVGIGTELPSEKIHLLNGSLLFEYIYSTAGTEEGFVIHNKAGSATAKGRFNSLGDPGGALLLSSNGVYSGTGSTFIHDDATLPYWDVVIDPRLNDNFAIRRAPAGASTSVANILRIKGDGSMVLTPSSAPVNTIGTVYFDSGSNWWRGGDGSNFFYFAKSSVASFTPGSVLFSGPSGQAQQDNSNLFWDDTGNRLHIGGNNPQRTAHITGDARITDLDTDAATKIVGADADGDLSAAAPGTGLAFTAGGVLYADTNFLATLTDVVIDGGMTNDFLPRYNEASGAFVDSDIEDDGTTITAGFNRDEVEIIPLNSITMFVDNDSINIYGPVTRIGSTDNDTYVRVVDSSPTLVDAKAEEIHLSGEIYAPSLSEYSGGGYYNIVQLPGSKEIRYDTVYTRVYGYLYGAPLDSLDLGGATDQASITGWTAGSYNSGHFTETDSSLIYSGPTRRVEVQFEGKLIGGAAGDVEIRIGYSTSAGSGTLVLPADQTERITLTGGSTRDQFYTSCQMQLADGYEIKARGARGDFGIREARLRVMQID